MIKNILAVGIVVALSACSSSSDSDNETQPPDTGNGGGELAPPTPPAGGGGTTTPPAGPSGGGAGPVTDTKAGSYLGNFGGAEGVYVINNENQLSGLAIGADGSAQSLFGDVGAVDTFTGSLRQFIHQESRGDGGMGSFGAVASPANDLAIDVTIVNGQSITSTAASPTAVSLLGTEGSSVVPATEAALAGSWQGVHSFCTDDAAGQPTGCQLLTTELVFNGTAVSGSTSVTDATGTAGTSVFITGGITEFGGAALIDFTWGDSPGYSGVVFFTPSADGRLAFVGENTANTGAPTISAVMNKQP